MSQPLNQQPYRKPKTFWSSFFGSCLGVFAAGFILSVLIFIFSIGFISALAEGKGGSTASKGVKEKSILHLKLNYDITDRTESNPFDGWDIDDLATKPGLMDLRKTIRYAATDDRIKGIYLDASGVGGGMATVEELRKELVDFKKSGKFIYTYGEYFSQKGYYLASVSDGIYLNPMGGMELKGLAINLMFYKRLLDKIGIQAEIFRPTGNKYKSAVEPYFLEKASDANRIQLKALIDDFWTEMLEKFSQKTGLQPEELNRIANTAPFIDEDHASFTKFITKGLYYDEFAEILKEKCGIDKKKDLNLISVEKYFGAVRNKLYPTGKTKIAIVYAEGEIVDGKGSKDNVGGSTFVKAIREARMDKDIKAVILRVNSPGGSAMASELIWREIILTKAEKPVIVSMGNYAASGGYYIACAADTIVADKTTLTGSIGVFSVAMNIQKLMEDKIGITSDTIKTNKYSDFPNANRAWSEEEKFIYQKQVDKIYTTFLKRVSEGRGIPVSTVDSLAQGRVWTGVDAKGLGLVDVIGDMEVAMQIAQKMVGTGDVEYVIYPEFKDKWSDFFSGFSARASEAFVSRQAVEFVEYYKFVRDARNLQGHQTRIPFMVDIY
jgi:protease-4